MRKYGYFLGIAFILFVFPLVSTAKLSSPHSTPQSPAFKPESLREKQSKNKSVQTVSFTLLKGGVENLSKYHGKILVVNFFATWCPPCMKEAPELVAFQKKWASKGVQVVAIAMDDAKQDVRGYVSRTKPCFPVAYFDTKSESIWGSIAAIPVTFIIDRNQHIVSRLDGYQSQSLLEEAIKPYL